MVNAAFPHNETNARSMETALTLLRSMADRGNAYLGSRHSLLLELRASIGPKPAGDDLDGSSATLAIPPSPNGELASGATMMADSDPHPTVPTENWQSDLPSFQDISFQFDLNDDPALWEGALDQIDIDMDTDWIENTLKRL